MADSPNDAASVGSGPSTRPAAEVSRSKGEPVHFAGEAARPAGKPARLAGELELRKISIRFGGLLAVSDFSLTIRGNELVGLIGPNGAGKTTIFNMLTGVYRPTSGQIFFCGRPLGGRKPYKVCQLGIARTFQNIRLFKNLSVLDNVRIGAHKTVTYGALSAVLRSSAFERMEREIEERSRSLLGIFGLERRAGEIAGSLPYGDQRRLEICRALASEPSLLLLDEPAAGMNTSEALGLMATIRRIRDEFRIAILLIEHNMEVVMTICERILVLNYGRTIAEGTPEQIQRDPVVIAAYLGEPEEAVVEAGL